MTPVDLAQVQRRAQRILDVAQLTVGQVDRTACVDGQQFDAANAALREHVDGRWVTPVIWLRSLLCWSTSWRCRGR
jgi:hypothetical protein